MTDLKAFAFIDGKLPGLDFDQADTARQCRYAVAATSRAAAVRALNAAGLRVTDGFLRSYASHGNVAGAYAGLADSPEVVFYQELNKQGSAWRPAAVVSTTTSYGSWLQVSEYAGSATVRGGIEASLYEHVADFDVDAIEREYRTAIQAHLPEGVTLTGDEFYGPHPMPADARDTIQAAIDAAGGEAYWQMIARHALRPNPLGF